MKDEGDDLVVAAGVQVLISRVSSGVRSVSGTLNCRRRNGLVARPNDDGGDETKTSCDCCCYYYLSYYWSWKHHPRNFPHPQFHPRPGCDCCCCDYYSTIHLQTGLSLYHHPRRLLLHHLLLL